MLKAEDCFFDCFGAFKDCSETRRHIGGASSLPFRRVLEAGEGGKSGLVNGSAGDGAIAFMHSIIAQ